MKPPAKGLLIGLTLATPLWVTIIGAIVRLVQG